MTFPLLASVLALLLSHVAAQPATLAFQDCFSGNVSQKLNISTVYAQVLDNDSLGSYLNLTLFGQSSQDILGMSNESSSLATLFTTTSILTLNAWTNSSYLCSFLRPPSPLPAMNTVDFTYCPVIAGPFGFSTSVPWGDHRSLTTLNTRLRAVDPFSNELLCLSVSTTPLNPGQLDSPYGAAVIILWGSVALAIAYWVVVGIARIASAWGRGVTRPGMSLWTRVESAGFILASAISGERLATSPALMRFSTPCLRDVIFHTQWCAALAMIAVQWPSFVYPLLAQTAWSTLSYNITLSEGIGGKFHHWDPLSVAPFNPPSNFADQVADAHNPLFINTSAPNVLFTLPDNATDGIVSFAYTVGLRPEDLFPVCLIVFLAVMAGAIVISLSIWLLDWIVSSIGRILFGNNSSSRLPGARSPRFSAASKDVIDNTGTGILANSEESKALNGHVMFRPSSRFAFPMTTVIRKHWWKIRPDISSLHMSVLHGNLVRILVWFHLPVTIFSSYQMTLPRSRVSLLSIILAALSFAIFSVLIPVTLVFRVTTTSTNKLYDETRTLLSLGALYNHYRHGSQLFATLLFASNIAFGVTIGCGQKSGMAQAIIILIVEVVSALVTSIWLPWGQGASMGLISFLFCVARIVVAVLLVILSPTISIGSGPGGWVAYGILVILALVYLALLLMLLVKIFEALVRIVGGVGFDRSNHVVDSGLIGAFGLLGCCGPRRRPRHRSRRHRYRDSKPNQDPLAYAPSETSSYSPPNALSGSRKGSTNSGQPPSVLKPEHALRPYKEDSDDENGYIMGAWQAYPRPGYAPVGDAPAASAKPANVPTTSGFSRVGGGRAHYETPYAITSGSTQTFPSVGQHSTATAPPALFDDDDSPPPSLSNVARRYDPETGLPPGAMQPFHVRTKSQTAVIEDSSTLGINNLTSTAKADPGKLPPPINLSGQDEGSDLLHPPKKPWYHLRRNRPHSSEGSPAAHTEEAEPLATSSTDANRPPGRSFVVIRDKKPQGSPARPHSEGNVSSPPATDPGSSSMPGGGSFVVVRDKANARTGNATT